MLFSKKIAWQDRLDAIVRMTRQMSSLADPQEMVRVYGDVVRDSIGVDGFVALSRRGLERPRVRVTRSHLWGQEHNPWRVQQQLPIFDRGLFSELIHSEQARLIENLSVDPDDPAYPHVQGFGSLAAIPQFDTGVGANMIVSLKREPSGFDPTIFPEMVWMSNLFGRATHNLVLSQELKKAYDALDRELKVVGQIQQSLLPSPLPQVRGLELAAHYQTSRRAGGDYYDFFPLPDDRWGIFIADVSGHGTPAAVMMAMTHTMAHAFPGHPEPPHSLLSYLNQRLAGAASNGSFVTAFYAIYDPAATTLTYSSAGHNPPRVLARDACTPRVLDSVQSLPLGIEPGERYEQAALQLHSGDTLLFYTDGITEVFNAEGVMFGAERLDQAFCQSKPRSIETLMEDIVERVQGFSRVRAPADDQTLLIARVK